MEVYRPTDRQRIELEVLGVPRELHTLRGLLDVLPPSGYTRNHHGHVEYGFSVDYPRPKDYVFIGQYEDTAIVHAATVLHYLYLMKLN